MSADFLYFHIKFLKNYASFCFRLSFCLFLWECVYACMQAYIFVCAFKCVYFYVCTHVHVSISRILYLLYLFLYITFLSVYVRTIVSAERKDGEESMSWRAMFVSRHLRLNFESHFAVERRQWYFKIPYEDAEKNTNKRVKFIEGKC